ncbi:hypothetical protein GF373_16940 [bacterium]|nr:hypothetical protein [bacterium]
MRILSLFLFILLLVGVYSWGGVVYVDPSSPRNGDGSLSNPYNDWQHVDWAAGNTYLQKRGTVYKDTITVQASGTEDNWIVLGAYGEGEKPKIAITGPREFHGINASSGENGIIITKCSYVKIKHFSISTTGDAEGIYGRWGDHNVLEHVEVGPTGSHGVWLLFKNLVTVRNCIFHHSGGIEEWKSADNIHLENCHDYRVEYCVSYNALQGAVYDASDGGKHYTDGTWRYNIGYRTPDSKTEHSNWSIYKMSGHSEQSKVKLLYNIAYGSFNGPAYALQEELDAIAIGNLAYNCQAGFQHVPAGNIIKNNIVANCDEVIYFPRGNFPAAMDHNLYFNNKAFTAMGEVKFKNLREFQSATDLDKHSKTADPRFRNASHYNFTLKSGSPAIDAGENIAFSLGAGYQMALAPASDWISSVSLLNQNRHGYGWEIGPFIHPTASR